MNTLGGSCDHDNCSNIWSAAATPTAQHIVGRYFYRYMKQHHPNNPTNPQAEACFKKAI